MLSQSKQLLRLQAGIWLFSALLFYLRYKIPAYPTVHIVTITINSFIHFILIFYGYLWIYRRYYARLKQARFVLLVAGFLVAVVVMKITLENTLVARTANGVFFRLFYSAGVLVSDIHLFNSFSACFFVLLTAILFTYFTESLSLRAKQAEISKRHMEAELNGLKAHVQPHFLFNSLNNLYYDTYKTMPRVADRIAMLSDIMRYFMEESPKSLVPLETELEFIHDFIQLEKVRISYPVDITVDSSVDQRLLVPPMLLIPLVENAFKHGLSELGEASFIRIALRQEGKTIRFTTTNRKIPVKADAERRGTGLKNLRERLALLFGENHSLQSRFEEGNHIAELIIPVYENEVRGGGR